MPIPSSIAKRELLRGEQASHQLDARMHNPWPLLHAWWDTLSPDAQQRLGAKYQKGAQAPQRPHNRLSPRPRHEPSTEREQHGWRQRRLLNSSQDWTGGSLFEAILVKAQDAGLPLARKMTANRAVLIAVLTEAVEAKRAADAAAAVAEEPQGEELVVAKVKAADPNPMPVEEAVAFINETAGMLASKPPPTREEADESGLSVATYRPTLSYLSYVNSVGSNNVPLDYHLGMAEMLRIHSSQFDKGQWSRAVKALRKAAQKDTPQLDDQGVVDTDNLEVQGTTRFYNADKSSIKGEGEYKWDDAYGGRPLVRMPFRQRGPTVNDLMRDAGLRKGTHYRWVKEGSRYWLAVPPEHIEVVAEAIAETYPETAKALTTNAPIWRARQTQEGARQAADAQDKRALIQDQDLAELNPSQGNLLGGEFRWEWASESPTASLLLPYHEAMGLKNAGMRLQIDKRRIVQPNGQTSYEYWREIRTEDAKAVAAVLKDSSPEIARVVDALGDVWTTAKPKLTREGRLQAISLFRRFKHMLAPEVVQDENKVQIALQEVMGVLQHVQPGDEKFDLGPAFGRWEVREGRKSAYLYVSVGTNVYPNPLYVGRARRADPANMKWHVQGADWVGKEPPWITVRVPLKRTPQACRNLDRAGLFGLSMSIRVALLTDELALRDNCLELEQLASANSIPDIPDEKLQEKANAVMQRLLPRFPQGLAPYPYQKVGIVYAMMSGYRCLIGDSMGLGKTVQAIGCLMLEPEKLTPALVVCPTSVTYNWQKEIRLFGPKVLRSRVLTTRTDVGMPRSGEVDIIGSDSLRLRTEELQAAGYRTIILDESHYFKNAGTQRSEAAASLALAAPHALLLSGTSMENKPKELWHQLYMLDPDTFSNQKEFEMRFANARQRTVVVKGRGGTKTTRSFWDNKGDSNLEELRDMLRCLMIRRKKTEVLAELPAKTRVADWRPLPQQAASVYRKMEDKIQGVIENNIRQRALDAARAIVLQRVEEAELRPTRQDLLAWAAEALELDEVKDPLSAQEWAHLAMVQMGEMVRLVGRLKIPMAAKWLENFLAVGGDGYGSGLVVFVKHQPVLKAMLEKLEKMKIKHTFIDGSVAPKKRTERVASFQNGEVDVIVCTQAAREGITLTRADTMLFVERWWVPSREEQAEDRIWRISQKNAVTINYLMAENTVDVRINELVSEKRDIIDQVMGTEDVGETEAERRRTNVETNMQMAMLKEIAARIDRVAIQLTPDAVVGDVGL